MRRTSKEDQPHVIEIISKAFYDNKSVNYVIRQGVKENNLKRIEALINYGFNLCFHYGEIWLDEKIKGV